MNRNNYKNIRSASVVSLSFIFSFIAACASSPGSGPIRQNHALTTSTVTDPVLFDCFDSSEYFRRAAASYQQGIPLDQSLAAIQSEAEIPYSLKVRLSEIVREAYRDKPDNFLVYGRDRYKACENQYGRAFKESNTDACYSMLFAIDVANNLKLRGVESADAKQQINELFKIPDMSKLGLRSMPDVIVGDLYQRGVTQGNYSRRRFSACKVIRSGESKNLRVTEILSGDHFLAENVDTGQTDDYFVRHLKAPREGEINFELAKQMLADNILNKEFSSTVIENPNGYSEIEVESRVLRLLSQDGVIVQRESEPDISNPLGDISNMTLSLLSLRNRSSNANVDNVPEEDKGLLWDSLKTGMSVADVHKLLPESSVVTDGMVVKNGSSDAVEKVRLITTVFGFEAIGRMYFDDSEKLIQVTFAIELPEDNLSAANLRRDFVKQLVKEYGREDVDLNTHSYRLHSDYTSWHIGTRDVDLVFFATLGGSPLMNLVYQNHNPDKKKRMQESFK